MQTIQIGEAIAAKRRIRVVLVDDTDGKTPETGITLAAGDLKLSKAGGAEANHAGAFVELAGGASMMPGGAGVSETVLVVLLVVSVGYWLVQGRAEDRRWRHAAARSRDDESARADEPTASP